MSSLSKITDPSLIKECDLTVKNKWVNSWLKKEKKNTESSYAQAFFIVNFIIFL